MESPMAMYRQRSSTGMDLVVFDMAGTTVEDRGEVLRAFAGALGEQRIPVTEEELRPWRGASKREVLRAWIGRHFGPEHPDNMARVERAYASFCQRLEASYALNGVQAMPGAEETFAWLCERGIRIALTTGFYRRVTDIILQQVGWEQGAVDATVCSDEVARGRPAPYMIFRAMEATGVTSVRRVVKVGDTVLDLMAGTNAGVGGVVGVLSGSHGEEQLASVDHTHIVPSVAGLPDLLEDQDWQSFSYGTRLQ